MAKQFVAQLEPTWVSDDSERLGKISKNTSQFIKAPTLYDVVRGKEKFISYFENPSDQDKTRYYLARADDDYDEKILLASNGNVFLLHDRVDDVLLRFVGVYFRQQGAPTTKKAPGGFVQCGDDEYLGSPRNNSQLFLAGHKTMPVSLANDMMNSLVVDYNICSDEKAAEVRRKHVWGTISYKCLARFLFPGATSLEVHDADIMRALWAALASERLVLNDITVDDTENVTVKANAAHRSRHHRSAQTR